MNSDPVQRWEMPERRTLGLIRVTLDAEAAAWRVGPNVCSPRPCRVALAADGFSRITHSLVTSH
jgi:hypothetical protein